MLFSGMTSVPESTRTEIWKRCYQASIYQKEFVANRSGTQPASQDNTDKKIARRQFGYQQWLALVRRNSKPGIASCCVPTVCGVSYRNKPSPTL
jgi:hypothetical protein